jgi:RNA-binding protein Nova
LKFLFPKKQAGCFIGPGGQSIKDLMEVTGADIHISSIQDTYPGTTDRVVYMTGKHGEISAAQTMVWEMIGRVTEVGSDGIAEWNPRLVSDSMDGENVHVEGKITIPSLAAGSILGKGGSTIQSISEDSGAKLNLSNTRSDPPNTNERVVSLSGTVRQCATATDLILAKLLEEPETAQYVTGGTKYPSFGSESKPRAAAASDRAPAKSGRGLRSSRVDSDVAETLSASTTITIAVPNAKIGNILGKQGVTLKEIITLSGANITISNKGEFIEGTNNRVVTITGPPVGAQTAHTLISNILSSLE